MRTTLILLACFAIQAHAQLFQKTRVVAGDGISVTKSGADFTVATTTNVVQQPKWDDTQVPAFAVGTGASAPSIGNFGPSGNLQAYLFQAASQNDQIYFTVQMPHAWLLGSPVVPHAHWCRVADPNLEANTNVIWGLEYSWANISGEFAAPTTILVTNGVASANWKHQVTSFGYVTNATGGMSSILNCRFYRVATGDADTYTGNAAFLGFDVHYQIDSLG